jgi:predicted nuclease of predicted toxin-antitoxin system
VHWASVGPPSAADSRILAYAEANAYVIFTHDLDFGALLAALKTRGPSVLQVRTQDPCPNQSEPPSSAPSRLCDLTSKQVPSSQWIAYGTESECCRSKPTN